jgi:tetratricopeptide (TPR) repeat protein
MDFLKQYLPAPLVDLGLPLLVVGLLLYFIVPKLMQKLRERGVFEQLKDKIGGEKLRQLQFDREIARLRKQRNFVGAAQLYEEAGWYPEAINCYLEAEEYTAAGDLYEKTEQFDRAADMYQKANDWKRAAKLYANSGRPEKAAEIYVEHGQKIDAAKLYFEAKRFDKAAELYEQVNYHPQAAQAFEKLGQFLRAGENYEQHWSSITSVGGGGLLAAAGSDREAKFARLAGQMYEKAQALDKAAAIYDRAGMAKEAAALAAKLGHFDRAGELLLKEEKLSEAADMFEKAGQVERAALLRGEVAFREGDSARAGQEFFKGKDYLRAAEIFESIGDLASAASCFEKSDSPLQAANVYLRAGKKKEAAGMFERGHDFETAAKLYQEVGETASASNLFEKAGRFFEAGKSAHALGQPERAIKLLQQVDSGDENYEAATLTLCRLFIDSGKGSLAVDKLTRLLGNRPVSGQTLDHFYTLGLAYEKLGQRTEAIETFKKILAERYGYEDVEQRIARLSAGPPAREAAAAAPRAAPNAAPPPSAHPAAPPAAPAPGPAAAPRYPASAVHTQAGVAQPRPVAEGARATPQAPFQLEQELGQGFLGRTFKGIDTRNGAPVAIKLLRKELLANRDVVQHFLAEAKLARTFDHPNLVRLLGLVELQGEKAVVMEYVEGVSLAAILARSKRFSVKQTVDLINTLCSVLGYAHERKLLHRDLKLTNVLVGQGGRLRIAGFGLGALRLAATSSDQNGYLPPELQTNGGADARSDLFSLGGMAFHGLTGLHPESPQAKALGAPSMVKIVPALPPKLDQVVVRCLAANPAARFASAAELQAACRGIA